LGRLEVDDRIAVVGEAGEPNDAQRGDRGQDEE
jgi:hypothetical protein